MVASNAREALAKENEMLNQLVQTASTYAQNAVGELETAMFNAWVEALSGHRDINADLISKSDSAFEAAVKEEAGLLENSLNPITGGSDVAKYWKAQFNKDIEISQKLL
jgi:hypothetical protein